VIEAADPADRLPLTGDVTWIDRAADAPAADASALIAAVTNLHLPDVPGVAYVAGEARAVQAIRSVLVSRHGWPRRAVHTKPFWSPGKRGME
jgi:NADPH-dependent ferric siderophore reductase